MQRNNKRYQIIYADPLWAYRQSQDVHHGNAARHYSCLTIDAIQQLQVSAIAAENCALFLWCTFPLLNEQISLFDYWGFRYRTVGFTWLKTNPQNGRPFFGMGRYTKSNAEVCLLGIKGKIQPVSNRVSSAIISPRQEHSRKPAIVRDKIVELFGDLPRIELFARERVAGWDALGNEIDGRDIRQSIAAKCPWLETSQKVLEAAHSITIQKQQLFTIKKTSK